MLQIVAGKAPQRLSQLQARVQGGRPKHLPVAARRSRPFCGCCPAADAATPLRLDTALYLTETSGQG